MAVTGRTRVTAEPRALDMRTFPFGGAEGTACDGGAFRDRVRAFLARFTAPSAGAWRVGLRAGEEDGKAAAAVVMGVVEEDVARAGAARIYCDHCTVAGESLTAPARLGRFNLLMTAWLALSCYRGSHGLGIKISFLPPTATASAKLSGVKENRACPCLFVYNTQSLPCSLFTRDVLMFEISWPNCCCYPFTELAGCGNSGGPCLCTWIVEIFDIHTL
jgi:hypothetical protein